MLSHVAKLPFVDSTYLKVGLGAFAAFPDRGPGKQLPIRPVLSGRKVSPTLCNCVSSFQGVVVRFSAT